MTRSLVFAAALSGGFIALLGSSGIGHTESPIVVEGRAEVAVTSSIATIEHPEVGKAWLVRGTVSHRDVEGEGYIEMWSVLKNHDTGQTERYFSRTLAQDGPSKSLRGSAERRSFELPFRITRGHYEVSRLELVVHLPGAGRVEVHDFEVVDVPATAKGGWWTPAEGGVIGAVAGALVGLLFGLLGTLTGLGKARALVDAGFVWASMAGIAALAVGVAAVAIGQPYEVFYPLLLVGGLTGGLGTTMRWTARKRFDERERQRMRAMDRADGA